MTGETPAGAMTFLAASSTLKWVGGISGSGTCLTVTTMSIGKNVSKTQRDVILRRDTRFAGPATEGSASCLHRTSTNPSQAQDDKIAAATISAMSRTAKR